MRGEIELEPRHRAVLTTIIRQYVSNSVPVGSKAVADRLPEAVSSATIRNIMAELEDIGFLAQPHISSGRVPTDKAYRFYVDRMVAPARLGPATVRYIDESLCSDSSAPDLLMAKTSHVLSEVSRTIGLVLGSALEEKLLEHTKFVKLPDQRVLAVIVSKPDLVENKVIRMEEEVSQEDLDQAAGYLNTHFRGWSLRTIRLEIFHRMEEMKALCDRLLSNLATLFTQGALGGEEPGPLVVNGTEKILDNPEFEDVRKVRELLETFEEKGKLLKMITACLQSSTSGVRVLIGRENPAREMHQCTIILAPYHYRERMVGALGVVGPTRMEYDRAIPTVDYVANLYSKLLSIN